MKTLRSFFSLAAMSVALVACNGEAAPEDAVEANEAEEVKETETATVYTLDTEGNEVYWEGFQTFTDKVHMGYLQVSDGELSFEEGNLVGGSFTMDMTSIENTDLPEDGDYNQAKLEGHLKSPDFFAVDSFPTATFEITNVTTAPDTAEMATHMINGNLTMRGETKNIQVPAKVEQNGDMVSLTTPEFVIDRSSWGVKFRSTSFADFANLAKDKVIDNNIRLKVDLQATKS